MENPGPTNHQEELIDLAYSMAIEPERYRVLFAVLDDHMHAMNPEMDSFAHGAEGKSHRELERISPHFDRAAEMLDRQGRRFNYATGSFRYIEADTRPSALITSDGMITRANEPCKDLLGFSDDQLAPDTCFEHGHYARLRQDLKKLDTYKPDEMISVYTVYAGDDDTPIKLALTKSLDYHGAPLGRLCTFHVKWSAQMETRFAQSFDLTPVEVEITRAVVSGQQLADLAQARGRSLATLRKQMKVLLRKLNLSSQVELACVYSGFTQFSQGGIPAAPKPKKLTESHTLAFELKLPDGRALHYETCGPTSGRPVLYFHALNGGTMLTKAMRDEVLARNIHLILVWRPFFAGSTPDDCPFMEAPARFALDIENLLDNLRIESCQILGHISGGIFAYACAQSLGARITGIINVAAPIPLTSKIQYKLMSQNSRASLKLARYGPKLLPMIVRAMLSRIDAGFDEEFSQSYYSDSPLDIVVVNDPEIKAQLRRIYPIFSQQGEAHMSRDIALQAGKWGHYLKGVTCPITLIHGSADTAYVLSTIEKFANERHNTKLIALTGAQLLMYQDPKAIFAALDA